MRNKIIALMLIVVLVLCLSGCSGTFEGSKDYTKRTGGRLQPTMMQDLYYDTNTKIVYIYFLMNVLDIPDMVICLLIMRRMGCPMFITLKPIAQKKLLRRIKDGQDYTWRPYEK